MPDHDYEKLGFFYLGREYDIAKREDKPKEILYNSKDLTTHAVCVGMTGSGKTGLCLALLEEAAIDGIPAIAIDPKGDLGNLLLTFPELKPADFAPWIEDEAKRKGCSTDEYAAKTAETWRKGLEDWDESKARIKDFKEKVDAVIYTPGSNAGLPLTVLKSFAAPPPALLKDVDALRERISSAASGLLALMGIDADPIRSREHILISKILEQAWGESKSLDFPEICKQIQSPTLIKKVGSVELESFFPAKARRELAIKLNNLDASPAFAGWKTAEPLDIGKLLYTDKCKPRLAIISIAHLSDSERMFFVTILLNELLAWVRTQSGTSSLRHFCIWMRYSAISLRRPIPPRRRRC